LSRGRISSIQNIDDFAYGRLMVDGKRIFAPVEICKFPNFNIGIFDHAIPTGVIAVISSITSHESQGFVSSEVPLG